MAENKTPTHLANKNAHERDKNILFEEIGHVYTVCGERGTFTSITTLIHKLFPSFNTDKILNTILNSKKMNDPIYKYYGKTREDILQEWDINKNIAAESGTNFHYDIECYYNGIENNNKSIEFSFFKKFVKDFPDLKCYRTEWCVYYEEYKLSGSIDCIMEMDDGTIQIYDWKRCKSIEFENCNNETAIIPCLKHLPNTNYHMYSLQLNLYKTILEEKYGKKVSGLFLVVCHPDNVYKTYERIEVPFMEKEIKDILQWWKEKNNL